VLIVVFAPLGSKINNVTNEDIALPGGSQSKQVQDLLRDRFAAGDTRTAVLVYRRAASIPLVGTPVPPFTQGGAGQVSTQGDVAFTIVPIIARGRYHIVPTIDDLAARRSAR